MTERRLDHLALALRRVLAARPRQDGGPRDHAPLEVGSRLDALEREVGEVRTRVNALFFAVISVAIGDLVVRAVHP